MSYPPQQPWQGSDPYGQSAQPPDQAESHPTIPQPGSWGPQAPVPQEPFAGQRSPFGPQPGPGEYPGQPVPGQPFSVPPTSDQPYPGQPFPQPPPGQPFPGQPFPGQPFPPQSPGQPFPQPPEPKTSWVKAVAGTLVVILLGCGVVVGKRVVKTAARRSTHSSSEAPSPAQRASENPVSSPSPSETSGTDVDLEEGDCFVNEGTDSTPLVKKVACGPGAYEVVARVNFTTTPSDCDNSILGAGEGNYTATFTHDESPGTLGDYVLCLTKL